MRTNPRLLPQQQIHQHRQQHRVYDRNHTMNRQPSLPPSEQTSTFSKRMPLGLTVDGATTIEPATVPACVLALAQPLARNAIAAIAE
jgi:hypothetical protein